MNPMKRPSAAKPHHVKQGPPRPPGQPPARPRPNGGGPHDSGAARP